MSAEPKTVKRTSNAPKLTDMCSGNPLHQIFLFALPLMIGSACQQVYTLTDTAVIGRVLGVTALSALGACDLLIWTVSAAMQAYTEGFSIRMANYFGAKDRPRLHQSVITSAWLSIVAAVLICTCMEIAAPFILRIMQVQDSVYPYALLYLHIIYAGIPFVVLYNYFFAVLRALGNSKEPLNAMLLSAGLNIVLDILLVVVFRLGIGGAAVATVFSQFVSMVYSFRCVMKLMPEDRSELRFNFHMVGYLLKLAVPMAIQLVVSAFGGLVMQSVVNTNSVSFMAGYAATYKIYGLLEFAAISYGYAITTYTSQNLGAGNLERIRKGTIVSELLALGTSVFFILLIFIFGYQIVGLFISASDAEAREAIEIGTDFLRVMGIGMPMLYTCHLAKGWVQGLGYATLATINSFAECLTRVITAIWLVNLFGSRSLFFAEPLAWSVGAVFLTISGLYYMRKISKGLNRVSTAELSEPQF